MRYSSLVDVYRDSLLLQNASNLGAVVKTLDEMITFLRTQPDCTGTDWINTHPAVILVVDKLTDLTHCHERSGDGFWKAHDIAVTALKELGIGL